MYILDFRIKGTGRMEKLNHWVEDWLFSRAEAERTRKLYLRNIKICSDFCQRRGKDLYGIVNEYRAARREGYEAELDFTESWQDLARAYSTYIKRGRYAPLTQKNILATAKSFLSYYKIPVTVELPRRAYVIYHNRDLTRENLKKILSKASQRDRTIWLLMAESGLRVSTAIHLKYWQIKDDFEKGIVPMRILTPAESLKDHVGDRWSFIGEDGVKALKEYLEPRLPLNDQDFVFTSKKPERMKGEQFTAASLSMIWRNIVRDLKLEQESTPGKPKHFRMHGLRKYFRNNMRADYSYREFWMGHSLGVDEHYISRDVEVHRKEYRNGYEQLRIYESTPAIISEITEQMKQKDMEIQELRDEIKHIRKYTDLLESLQFAENRELTQEEKNLMMERVIKLLWKESEKAQDRSSSKEE